MALSGKNVPYSFEPPGVRSTICYHRALAGPGRVSFNKILHVRWLLILCNFMKQAVLGLHIHFKLMVSPFYFPYGRVKKIWVLYLLYKTK